MNYSYEIQDSDYSRNINEIIIIELLNNEYKENWYLPYLKNNCMDHWDLHLKNSFMRTRNWVLQNYPELIL